MNRMPEEAVSATGGVQADSGGSRTRNCVEISALDEEPNDLLCKASSSSRSHSFQENNRIGGYPAKTLPLGNRRHLLHF